MTVESLLGYQYSYEIFIDGGLPVPIASANDIGLIDEYFDKIGSNKAKEIYNMAMKQSGKCNEIIYRITKYEQKGEYITKFVIKYNGVQKDGTEGTVKTETYYVKKIKYERN